MGWKLTVPKPSESQIERLIGDFLTYKRVFFWKATSAGFFDPTEKIFKRQKNPYALNGVPDYCLVIQGKFYGWEIKSDSGKQSKNQKIFEYRLIKEGRASYVIIRSLQDAERELDRILSIQ